MSDATSVAVLFLLAHLVGDYVVQTEWMAAEKTTRWWPAIVHGLIYGACYVAVTRSLPVLAVIAGTHIVIDHYRLAKWIVWVKNQAAPRPYRYPWNDRRLSLVPSDVVYRGGFGERRVGLQIQNFAQNFWLMIIADNTVHLLINYASLRWL